MNQRQPLIDEITQELPPKTRTKLAKRIAKHIAHAGKMPVTPMMMMGKLVSYILVGAMAALTIAILIKPQYLASLLEWILHHISTLGAWNYVLAGGISLIESIPFLNMAVPGQTIAIVIAGYVAQYNFLGILLVVVMASTVGDAIAYWLGKRHGAYMLAHFGPIFGLNDVVIEKIEHLIEKMGNWAVFVSKRNSYTRGFLPFIAGALRMPFREFMLYNMFGSAVFGGVLVFLAKMFIGHYREVVPYIRWIGLGMIVVLGMWYWWKHGRNVR